MYIFLLLRRIKLQAVKATVETHGQYGSTVYQVLTVER